MSYQPKTGERCYCKKGIERDNCPSCEGTGMKIDFKKIRESYVKIRFISNKYGETAGIVLPLSDFRVRSLGDISRMFPLSCCRQMEKLEVSPICKNWDEAFNYVFPEGEL